MGESSVVVAGGGVVGLTTALGLARAGVDVTVYEAGAATPVGTADYVYHWSALPVFAALDVLGPLERAGIVAPRWAFFVPETGRQIVFDLGVLADEVEHPYHLTVRREVVVEVLTAAVEAFPSGRVLRGRRVTGIAGDPAGVAVRIDGPDGPGHVRAGWVIGADGAGSCVRRSLGLGMAGHTWPERLVSTTLGFDLSTFCEAPLQVWPGAVQPAVAQLIEDGGPGGERLWRFAYPEQRTLPEDTIPGRMSAMFGAILPARADPLVSDWSAYRMHERVVGTYRVGRTLLIGDAAHLTNPTSGLGMAAGLYDALSVVERLPAVIEGADPGVLDDVADTRRRVFCDQVSPASAEHLNLSFYAARNGILAEKLDRLAALAADRDALRVALRNQRQIARGLRKTQTST